MYNHKIKWSVTISRTFSHAVLSVNNCTWETGCASFGRNLHCTRAIKRSKVSERQNRRQSVTPYIHPCLHSRIHTLDQFYITKKPFPLLMNAPRQDLAIWKLLHSLSGHAITNHNFHICISFGWRWLHRPHHNCDWKSCFTTVNGTYLGCQLQQAIRDVC